MEYFSNSKPNLIDDNIKEKLDKLFLPPIKNYNKINNNNNLLKDIFLIIKNIYNKFIDPNIFIIIIILFLTSFLLYKYYYKKKTDKKKYSTKEIEIVNNLKNKFNINYDEIINQQKQINNNFQYDIIKKKDIMYDNSNINYNNINKINSNNKLNNTIIKNENIYGTKIEDLKKNNLNIIPQNENSTNEVDKYINSLNNDRLWNESSKKNIGKYNLDNDDDFMKLLNEAKKDPDIIKDYLDTYIEPPYQL